VGHTNRQTPYCCFTLPVVEAAKVLTGKLSLEEAPTIIAHPVCAKLRRDGLMFSWCFIFLRPVAVSTAATCFIYRTSTGEAWQMIMMDCGREETMCDERSDTPDQSCGSFWFSIIYFITFYILCSFLVSTTVVHDDAYTSYDSSAQRYAQG